MAGKNEGEQCLVLRKYLGWQDKFCCQLVVDLLV